MSPSLNVSSPATARRTPVQFRSQQTVQRVLDAASSLLTQMPLEDVTTTRIAVEAGLSIGALYRFFPDKQTIIDAIAVRHVNQFRGSLEAKVIRPLMRELENLQTFDPAIVLDSMIDAYTLYLDAHPDFRTISFGRYISAATKRREASPTAGLPAMLTNFMVERLRPSLHSRARTQAARRERGRRAPHRLRLRAAYSRRPRSRHLRDEAHVVDLPLPFRPCHRHLGRNLAALASADREQAGEEI